MSTRIQHLCALAYLILSTGYAWPAIAASANALDKDAAAALQLLYKSTPPARDLGAKAKAILVFPHVMKTSAAPDAQGGDGALLKNGKTVAYYNSAGHAVRLPATAQSFGYVLFLMNDAALTHLDGTKSWEIGTGPSIIVVDSGIAKTFSTMSEQFDVYAFIFDRIGLLAGAGLRGARVSKLARQPI